LVTPSRQEDKMFQKVLTVALVGAALATAACNCTENAINGQKNC
jgi:hypothetical protein